MTCRFIHPSKGICSIWKQTRDLRASYCDILQNRSLLPQTRDRSWETTNGYPTLWLALTPILYYWSRTHHSVGSSNRTPGVHLLGCRTVFHLLGEQVSGWATVRWATVRWATARVSNCPYSHLHYPMATTMIFPVRFPNGYNSVSTWCIC